MFGFPGDLMSGTCESGLFIAEVLGRIDLIAVQGDADASRIGQLGAESCQGPCYG